MARMKFLCDADRCIECNACVTACKNEHEVPWGINRRRVVTINDGKPGERSVSMACMHCTDAPCAAVCPVNCFYTTADARGAALQGPLHRLRLLLLRLPVRRAAISEGRQLRLARQDGQVHLSAPAARRRTARRPSTRSTAPTAWPRASCRCAPRCARPSRCSPATARSSRRSTRSAWSSAATAPAPGAGRRPIRKRSRPDGASGGARLNPPRRLSRQSGHKNKGGRGMTRLLAHARFIVGALALVFVVALAAPASAQQPTLGQSDRERGEGGPAAAAAEADHQRPRSASPTRSPARSSSRPAATGAQFHR